MDLKPENIFVKDGALKIADFGLSEIVKGNGATALSNRRGTLDYMAPEVINANAVYDGQLADIYSLGIVFFVTVFA